LDEGKVEWRDTGALWTCEGVGETADGIPGDDKLLTL